MPVPSSRWSLRPHIARIATALLLLATPVGALAQPAVGFMESFPGTLTSGWGGGAVVSNPGTGGALGAGDGFLRIAVPGPLPGNLGSFVQTPAYVGDWTAVGIHQVDLWLNDVGELDTLEMHFVIGNAVAENIWEYSLGFVPPAGQWAHFVVDLRDSASFSRIGTGPGNYTQALTQVDRILVRHDFAPYTRFPDTVVGDVGLDELLLSGGTTGVGDGGPRSRPRAVQLAPPMPNPARGRVTLRMETREAAPVRIQIVDALGRLVRHAELPAAAPGARTWTWDGVDDRGSRAAAGVYRVRAVGPGGGTSRPLVLLR